MSAYAIIFVIATFFSTYLGGLFSMKFKEKSNLIMAFTAGVLLGVVSFEILPEILEMINANHYDSSNVMIALVVGFLLFHILEKTILIHNAHEGDYKAHHHPHVGMLSAITLAGHSFMDGIGIGLGFQINQSVGIIVALAIISHDFTDGMNTVTMMLKHKNTLKKAKMFLFADAIAPALGAISTLFLKVPEKFLMLYLGFFAGFLLYIGASDILPEAHSERSSYKLIGLTVLGVALIFLITKFSGL